VLLAGLEELRSLIARRVRVIFSRDVALPDDMITSESELLESTPRIWQLEVHGALGPLLSKLAGLPVEDLQIREARLEDVVLKYYREPKT